MAADHSKEPKCCCLECKKEYYTIYFEKHYKSCKIRIRKADVNRVECPICGIRLKEINTAHLRSHGMTIPEFKEKFPDVLTMSEVTRKRKATLVNLTPEQSLSLRYGHTLQAKIEKWGEEEGRRRHEESQRKSTVSKTLEGYIERLGEEDGRRAWNTRRQKISSASQRLWNEKPDIFKGRGTLNHYVERFGEVEGLKRWCEMCSRKSISISRIPYPFRKPFHNYKILVNRVTKLNLKMYGKDVLGEKPDGYHTDHIFSQLQGFVNGVSPYLIGFIGNLRFIPASENCKKQDKCFNNINDISSGIETYPDYKGIIENDLWSINDKIKEILEQVKPYNHSQETNSCFSPQVHLLSETPRLQDSL